MKLVLERTLEDEKLTQQRVRDMRHDEKLTVYCSPDAAAWKTAERIAYNVRKNHERTDGFRYNIASSAVDMTVTVSLTRENISEG